MLVLRDMHTTGFKSHARVANTCLKGANGFTWFIGSAVSIVNGQCWDTVDRIDYHSQIVQISKVNGMIVNSVIVCKICKILHYDLFSKRCSKLPISRFCSDSFKMC